jgi:hypothetical protein
MPKLAISRKSYDVRLLQKWRRRRNGALKLGNGSKDLHDLLKKKARGRLKRSACFFGETYVASVTPHREGYYSSFKWLTNRRFVGTGGFPNGPAQRYQEQFREALQRHFGRRRLERLQQAARAICRSCYKELAGKPPTPPDLWLVDRRGHHRFIEVKLPGNSVAPHQLAGMAAIACFLKGPKRVSVEVIELHNEDQVFKDFCRKIKAG